MTVSPTYPGVYLAETTNVPHVVTPATTNLTAFLGDFAKGPVDRAVLVGSWREFVAQFGGIMPTSLATYGVRQFFDNGGIGAWIVRLQPGDGGTAATTATAALGGLTVDARSAGAWAAGLLLDLAVSTVPLGAETRTVATLTVSRPGPPAAVVETLTNLPAGTATELAHAIDERSAYVTVHPPAADAAAPATAQATLGDATDAVWTEATFVAAVNDQLSDGALLDGIAPRVFNLLCIPDAAAYADSAAEVYQSAVEFCERRQAFAIVDPPPDVKGADAVLAWGQSLLTPAYVAGAVYYPWLEIADPANDGRPRLVPPSGSVAGVYATVDTRRGVWKAPAGVDTTLTGVTALADRTMGDEVNGELNVAGVNCIRTFPVYGTVVWGARTLAGSDLAGSPWKYVSVRRLADFIEQSLRQSLRWAVFEPNTEPLWASIRLEVNGFLSGLFRDGAFAGTTAAQAYQVVCDATTTSPDDMLRGIVNLQVGFAPALPAEFVVLTIQLEAATTA